MIKLLTDEIERNDRRGAKPHSARRSTFTPDMEPKVRAALQWYDAEPLAVFPPSEAGAR
jgi:hypothetical protein